MLLAALKYFIPQKLKQKQIERVQKIKQKQEQEQLELEQLEQDNLDPIAKELISSNGVSYYGYLTDLVHAKGSKNYFEIGTNFGDSLASIKCSFSCRGSNLST